MFLNPKETMKTEISNMIQNNPRMKEVIDYVNANGGNPETAFYKLAEEKNINADEFLSSLKNSFFK